MNLRAYHPELGEVAYGVHRLSDDPDTQVTQTIQRMARNVREDATSAPILNEAAGIQASGSGDPVSDTFWHVKGRVGFRQDEQLAAPAWSALQDYHLANNPHDPGANVVEVIVRPRDLAQMPQPLEDCDGFASYLPALLRAQGVKCNFVTVAADARDTSRFSHVYAACYPNGQRVSLDASHGPVPRMGMPERWACLENQGVGH